MPGFFVCNKKIDIELTNPRDSYCKKQEICSNKYTIKRNTLNKFIDDKVFKKIDDYIIITEGVFLNKQSLCNTYNSSWCDVLLSLIKNDDHFYFDKLRGNFSGGHYNPEKDEWIFYTNTTEEKPVFYYADNGIYMVASELRYIITALRKLGIEYHVDQDAFYNALTFGFMVSDRTFIKECKKLPYGSFLVCKNGSVEVNRYYELNNEKDLLDTWSDQQLIDEWDRIFNEAVILNCKKDDEYGYSHIFELSGGVDSRMTTWVAAHNGFNPILNISYTQTDSLDEQIAKKVSQTLGTELMVKSLNSGKILMDYEEVIRMNYGLSLYPGIAYTNSILKVLNFEQLGAINTGTFGGVFNKDPENMRLEGAYSQKLSNRIKDSDLRDPNIENFELYKVRNREFRGNVCSQIALYNYSEVLSPFLYREFVDFYFKIPYDKRKNDYIYIKWIATKYPEAAKIPVERFQNGLMTDSVFKQKIRRMRYYGLKKSLQYVLWKLHITPNMNNSLKAKSMNPFDSWYENVPVVKNDMDSYMAGTIEQEKNKHLLTEQMYTDALELYNTGTAREKTQVITAIAAVKTLFID